MEININILNDKCLVNIFDFLPLTEKYKIDAVCKKWQRLNEQSWKHVTRLDLSVTNFPTTKFVLDIIKKCGDYLNYVNISTAQNLNYSEIFKEISKNCKNINKFRCSEQKRDGQELYTEYDIGLLLKRNPKIHSIYLYDMQLFGYCFLSVNAYLMTELTIADCTFKGDRYLHFISDLRNLKKIYIKMLNFEFDTYNIKKIIHTLNNSNCESIQDFFLNTTEEFDANEFRMLISKQKKLLKLTSKVYDKNFIDNLPADFLQELHIYKFYEQPSCFSKNFENLEIFKFNIINLTDEFIKNLSIKCKNLKEIHIEIDSVYSLTVVGEMSFSEFQKLEKFRFYNLSNNKINIDNILKSLIQCKKLSKLVITRFEFTDSCLANMCSILSLKTIHLCCSKITESKLIFMINKLVNLKKLDIFWCENITSCYIFELINDLKLNRRDKDILKIVFEPPTQVNKLNINSFTTDGLNLLKICNKKFNK